MHGGRRRLRVVDAQQVPVVFPLGLGLGISKQAFGAGVPVKNEAGQVQKNDGVVEVLEKQRLAPQLILGLLPAADVHDRPDYP
jgi:hypothetical protein